MNNSRSRFIDVRGLRYHLREWGSEGAPKLVMLHGWMDVSASFQFIVDELQFDWHVIAPDWRGFGQSAWRGDAYWFPDYLADLDAILRLVEPDAPVRLVGHSLGGNVACLYAGVRPARVARVVALDAFGLPDRPPEQAPGRYEKWLSELAEPAGFREYADFDAFARRLQRDNPRLTPERASWIARHLAEEAAPQEGGDSRRSVRLVGDPAHRRVNPILYRRAEAEACWRRILVPVLWIEPAEAALRQRSGVTDAMHDAARACFRDLQVVTVADAGHNLHHDQPERVAGIIEAFLRSEQA